MAGIGQQIRPPLLNHAPDHIPNNPLDHNLADSLDHNLTLVSCNHTLAHVAVHIPMLTYDRILIMYPRGT